MGYHSQVILAGRRINDDMGRYVAENAVKKLIAANKPVKGARVAILGFTFKENCPDTRNTKVVDIVNELGEYGIVPAICDPCADAAEAERLYGVHFIGPDEIKEVDAVIVAVAHDAFRSLDRARIDSFFGAGEKVLIDVKGLFSRKEFEENGYLYWRL